MGVQVFRGSGTAKSGRTVTFGKGKWPLPQLLSFGNRPRPGTPYGDPPRPPGPPGRWRRLLPSGHWRWLIAGAVASCLVTIGVAWAIWPSQPAAVPLQLVNGTVQADLLTPAQVSQVAGVTVVSGPRADQVPAAVSVTPSTCAAAAGPATTSVYGHSWTGFLSATYEDADGSGDYTVNQVVGVFPSTGYANAAFKTLTGGLSQCKSSTTTGQAGRTTKWNYSSYPATPVAVAWSASQANSGGWACYHQARVQGSALIQVAVCEGGNGQPAVSVIADAIGQKVSG